MVNVHLMGNSNKVYQHKVIVKWSKNAEKRAELEITLLSNTTFPINLLDNTRRVLGKSFSEVLVCQKLKTSASMKTMMKSYKDTKPRK